MSSAKNKKFGKVAVLMGGWSAEREISLLSGKAVLKSLLESEVDAHGIDVSHDIAEVLKQGGYDRAFIALHGRGGEDGVIQGLLDAMLLPYTGSGVLGSALAMDKLKTKQIWRAMDLPTPEYLVLDTAQSCAVAMQLLGLPLIIKPVLEGSSIGMTRVTQESEMVAAWRKAEACGGTIIAERWITGDEYTAGVLKSQVLPLILLETPHDFYDYDAKYVANDTRYICPCGLDKDDEAFLSALVLKAFYAVGVKGWGRVDFMVDTEGQPWLIEVNTVPGMTDHSLVPMAAKHSGMDFNRLVLEILETTDVGH